MLSSFHSHVVQNLYEFFLDFLFWTYNFFEECLVTKRLMIAIDFHSSGGGGCYANQWLPATFWSPAFLKKVLFCFQQMKETHTSLEHLGE